MGIDCRGLIVSRSHVFQGFFWNFPLIQIDPRCIHEFFFSRSRATEIWWFGGMAEPHPNRTIKHGFTSGVMTGCLGVWLFEGKLQFCSTVWPVAGCFDGHVRNISGVPRWKFCGNGWHKHGWYLESRKVNRITDPCIWYMHMSFNHTNQPHYIYIYTYVYTPRSQMGPLVLIEVRALFWRVFYQSHGSDALKEDGSLHPAVSKTLVVSRIYWMFFATQFF